MKYPVVLHKDFDSDYGVTVPDLPGCFSAGRTVTESLAMAREAIALHLSGLLEHGEAIPPPKSIEEHKRKIQFRAGRWKVANPDYSRRRVN